MATIDAAGTLLLRSLLSRSARASVDGLESSVEE
jgi:hypothetical protein